jgi:hypothetical protein
MTRGFALTLVAILCLTGQTPADEVVPVQATTQVESIPEGSVPAPVSSQVESIPEGPAPGTVSSQVESIPEGTPSEVVTEIQAPSVAQPPSSIDSTRWWFSSDYLMAWVRGSLLQPLVTTSPAGTPLAAAGVLSNPKTTILFGAGRFNDDLRSGFKLGAGGWFNEDRTFGVDMGFFMLESQNTLFFASSNGQTILARPFFNALTSKEDSQLVAFPGLATGSIGASLRSNNFYSGHIDLQEVFLESNGYRLESIVGYRYLRFDERLLVFQNLTSLGSGVIAAGTNIQTVDNFTVKNELNAADLGLRAELFGQRWSLELLAKMSVGRIHREAIISGLMQTTVPGESPVTNNGGMLAVDSNIGQHNSNDWIVVPELGATLGWNLTPNIRFRVGYDVFFWSNVTRASDQVDLFINPNQFPPFKGGGIVTPIFPLIRSDLCVQALNLGLEFRF